MPICFSERKTEDGRRKTEDRWQRTEDRWQKTEYKTQRTEDRVRCRGDFASLKQTESGKRKWTKSDLVKM